MSILKRAIKTWEISESDSESDVEKKPRVVAHDQDRHKTTDSIKRESGSPDRNKLSSSAAKAEPERDTLVPPPPTHQAGVRTASPGRKRRNKEEVEEDRQRAEERRRAREEQRAAKAREREERREEQQSRKEAAERLRCYRPENCLKNLTVCIDPALLQDEGSNILLGTLSAYEWRLSLETQQLPHSVQWTRDLPQCEASSGTVAEEQALLVLSISDFLDMVVCVKQTQQGEGEETEGEETEVESFLRPLLDCVNRNPEMVISVVVLASCQDSWGQTVRQTLQSQLEMDDLDIEEALVNLQLYRNVSVVFLDGWQEVTDHVCAVTKALAKRPLKKLTERTELPFCVDGSWASGVRVERDGSGLDQVWSRQVQQLNRVSPEVASTVTAAYPSPQLLLQAYEGVDTEERRRGLLARLLVRSGGKERRVGPEISTRVYRLLTTQNPHLVLD